MAKLRVHNYSMSVDGFVAGPDQDLEHPFGVEAGGLTEWVFRTSYGKRAILRKDVPADAPRTLDDEFLEAGDVGIGATIMGRNMFGPVRGDWGDDQWRGWWGPPYHHPVFVLTHHPHDPIPMEGGTTFNFVTDGIESALEQAVAAAAGQDVRLGGGCATVQQYLRAGLVDDLHIALTPVLLGRGERLFDGLDALPSGYEVSEVVPSPSPSSVTHVRITKIA
jgi:dihydrofolate reductase